jgi:hypothetical protein
MKSITFLMTLMILFSSFTLLAQKNSGSTEEKKNQLSFGFGVGVSTQSAEIVLVSGELQNEYRVAQQLSVYGSLGYNRMFSTVSGGGSAGYGSLLAGPRGYLSPEFFIGIGAGIAYFAYPGESVGIFNYNPHIGYNTKDAQFTLGYSGLSNNGDNVGFIQLKAILKFKH